MLRVRQDGWVVPRHNSGMQRAVRGRFTLREERILELNRASRIAVFRTDDGQTLRLYDAALMHASEERLVISGFERNESNIRTVDYAQTWVLLECHGDEPQGTLGPPFDR